MLADQRRAQGRRDALFTRGPADALDHATSQFAIGSKMGLDATRKLPGEGFPREWPPLIKMSEEVRRKMDQLFQSGGQAGAAMQNSK